MRTQKALIVLVLALMPLLSACGADKGPKDTLACETVGMSVPLRQEDGTYAKSDVQECTASEAPLICYVGVDLDHITQTTPCEEWPVFSDRIETP